MKSPEWHQRVLLLTEDLEVKASIRSVFGEESQFLHASTSQEAVDWIGTTPLDVLIIDAKATDSPSEPTGQVATGVSFLELSQYATQLNNRLTIIVLINKLRTKQADFARKCGATAIMDRKDFSVDALVYLIGALRKRTFRTVLYRDLPLGQELPVDLYHYLPLSSRYAVFLPAGAPLTLEKRTKLLQSHVRHLYVLETACEALFGALKISLGGESLSERLHHTREIYRVLLGDFFNMGSHGVLAVGKRMLEQAMGLVLDIERLVLSFPDPRRCLEELPYPRWSPLAHGLNSAIYTQIFGRFCGLESISELTLAALLHNLGLAEINRHVIRKAEALMTEEEKIEYARHISKSIEIIKRKLIPLEPIVESTILHHHENYDGSGFPAGLVAEAIPQGAQLLSLVGSFDYFNTVHPGQEARGPQEAWAQLKISGAPLSLQRVKFGPHLMAKMDIFFQAP